MSLHVLFQDKKWRWLFIVLGIAVGAEIVLLPVFFGKQLAAVFHFKITASKSTPLTSPSPSAVPSVPVTQQGNKNISSSVVINTSSLLAVTLDGSYRCFRFAVNDQLSESGCRLSPPFIFYKDGSYEVSTEKGNYTVQGDEVTLSESTLRGIGTLTEKNTRISFQYPYNGNNYQVTYLREAGSASVDGTGTAPIQAAKVEVNVLLNFSESDTTISWVNTATLLPDDKHASYDALTPSTIGSHILNVKFFDVEVGHIYTVSISNGFEQREVGRIDMREVDTTQELAAFSLEVPETTSAAQ